MNFSAISIFYIVVHNRSFLDILPNFNLLRALEIKLRFLDLYFREFTAAINFPSKCCVEFWKKWFHFLKNTANYNNNWCGTIENDIIFFQNSTQDLEGKLMAAVNSLPNDIFNSLDFHCRYFIIWSCSFRLSLNNKRYPNFFRIGLQ